MDPDKIERIEELVIPPAWRDVWISPRSKAKLQATGLDRAAGGSTSYHPEFRARQEREKYDKLVCFAELLPNLRRAMSKNMEDEPLSPEWTCALALRLINLGWFRVGTERYARTTRTFGITTLRKSHVRVRGSRTRSSTAGNTAPGYGRRSSTRTWPTRSRSLSAPQGGAGSSAIASTAHCAHSPVRG